MQNFRAINAAFTKRMIKLELAVDNFKHCFGAYRNFLRLHVQQYRIILLKNNVLHNYVT